MGIEIRFYQDGIQAASDIVLRSQTWTALAIGTPFYFEPKDPQGNPFVIGQTSSTLTPLNTMDQNWTEKLYENTLYPITTRNYGTYIREAHIQGNIDLERTVGENLNQRWLEIGPGLGEFAPVIAAQQAKRGFKGPVIIDPLDYKMLSESLIAFYESLPMVQFKDYLMDLIIRAVLMSRRNLVTQIKSKIEDLTDGDRGPLRGKFFGVIDFAGAILYSSQISENAYTDLLQKGGFYLAMS